MKIGQMFETKITERIEPVIKVGEVQDEKKLASEIGSFVVTPHIEEYTDAFLEHYTDTIRKQSTEIGVWISGYFGSGKSHLAKMLAQVTANRTLEGIKATKRFSARVPQSAERKKSLDRSLSLLSNCSTTVLAFNLNTLTDSRSKFLLEMGVQPGQQAVFPIIVRHNAQRKRLLLRLFHFQEEFASADFSSRFFGETAGKGLSLFDFLSRRYDVVATNPPYMGSKNMGSVVKRYVEKHFAPGKRDLYAAFILRCLELTKPETGRVAMVTQQSWMFLRSFADLRALDEEKLKKAMGFKGILRETFIEILAHLGPGAFGEISGEVVNIVLFTLAKKVPDCDHRLTAFRLIGPKSPEEKDALLRQAVFSSGRDVKNIPAIV